jgi:hypothetical protein
MSRTTQTLLILSYVLASVVGLLLFMMTVVSMAGAGANGDGVLELAGALCLAGLFVFGAQIGATVLFRKGRPIAASGVGLLPSISVLWLMSPWLGLVFA